MPEFEVTLKGPRTDEPKVNRKVTAKKPRSRIVVSSAANKKSKDARIEKGIKTKRARTRAEAAEGAKVKQMSHVPREIRSKEHLLAEKRTNRNLTVQQKKFAELYVENCHSQSTCARLAGYRSNGSIATSLLDPLENPQIAEYIGILQDDRQKMYGVTLDKQLKRLHDLSRGAEGALQYSAAINAEKVRSSLGGLTVDRREVSVVENMSKSEIVERLAYLQSKYPQLLTAVNGVDYKEVFDGEGSGIKPVARPQAVIEAEISKSEGG